MAIEMKICEYIHNITDIKYIQMLILNESFPREIEIYKNINENYDIYFLLSIDPTYYYGYSISTKMKVRLRNIKYPYLDLSDTKKSPYIWEGKIVSIDIFKRIDLMFR